MVSQHIRLLHVHRSGIPSSKGRIATHKVMLPLLNSVLFRDLRDESSTLVLTTFFPFIFHLFR